MEFILATVTVRYMQRKYMMELSSVGLFGLIILILLYLPFMIIILK